MTGCILLVLLLAVTRPVYADDLETVSGADDQLLTIAVMDFWSLNCPEELVQEFRRRIQARILWYERPDLKVEMVSSSDEDFRSIEGRPSFAALGIESYIIELGRLRGAQYLLTGQIITALDGVFITLYLYSIRSSDNVWKFSSRYSDSTDLYNQIPVMVSSLLMTDFRYAEPEPPSDVPGEMPEEADTAAESGEASKVHEFYRAVGITAGTSLRADFLDGSTVSALSAGLTVEVSSFDALEELFPNLIATQAGFGFGLHYLCETAPDFGGSHELQANLKALLPISIDYFSLGGTYALRWQSDGKVHQLSGFSFSPLFLSSWDFYPLSFEILPITVLYDFNDESWSGTFELLRIAACLEF